MTIDKEGLASLLERVRKAKGPDRELDALLHALADGRTVRETIHPQFGRQLLARNSRPPHDVYWLDHPANVNPPVTASTDASLALTERLLPGRSYNVAKHTLVKAPFFVASIGNPQGSPHEGTHDSSAPLAILVALLAALPEREG